MKISDLVPVVTLSEPVWINYIMTQVTDDYRAAILTGSAVDNPWSMPTKVAICAKLTILVNIRNEKNLSGNNSIKE